MKDRSFGQERKPFDWQDPQYGYTVDELTLDEFYRLLIEQAWAETEKYTDLR